MDDLPESDNGEEDDSNEAYTPTSNDKDYTPTSNDKDGWGENGGWWNYDDREKYDDWEKDDDWRKDEANNEGVWWNSDDGEKDIWVQDVVQDVGNEDVVGEENVDTSVNGDKGVKFLVDEGDDHDGENVDPVPDSTKSTVAISGDEKKVDDKKPLGGITYVRSGGKGVGKGVSVVGRGGGKGGVVTVVGRGGGKGGKSGGKGGGISKGGKGGGKGGDKGRKGDDKGRKGGVGKKRKGSRGGGKGRGRAVGGGIGGGGKGASRGGRVIVGQRDWGKIQGDFAKFVQSHGHLRPGQIVKALRQKEAQEERLGLNVGRVKKVVEDKEEKEKKETQNYALAAQLVWG